MKDIDKKDLNGWVVRILTWGLGGFSLIAGIVLLGVLASLDSDKYWIGLVVIGVGAIIFVFDTIFDRTKLQKQLREQNEKILTLTKEVEALRAENLLLRKSVQGIETTTETYFNKGSIKGDKDIYD